MRPAFPNYVPAALFYRVRREESPSVRRRLAEDLVRRIRRALRDHDYVVMPVHVRYHWTTAVIRYTGGRLSTVVYDSARHPATGRDIIYHFTRDLGLDPPAIVAHARQQRGSAECGLHVFLVGAWLAHGTRPLPLTQTSSPALICLQAWRGLLGGPDPLHLPLVSALMEACPMAAALTGFGVSADGDCPRPSGCGTPLQAAGAPDARGPTGALSTGSGVLHYAIPIPEQPPSPVAPSARARRSQHGARAQRGAAATFDPTELEAEYAREIPVPLARLLAVCEGLSPETLGRVREFYAHCDPQGGKQAALSFARFVSPTADDDFWTARPFATRFEHDPVLRDRFMRAAADVLASVAVHSASADDRVHMAYSAYKKGTYLSDTAVDAAVGHAVRREPPATGWSYLPCRVLTWWHGRGSVPPATLWDPAALTSRVATVARISPDEHFVALSYDGGTITIRDSWEGDVGANPRFDARRAPYGPSTLRWAGVFGSFLRHHCGLPVQAVARYEPCRRQRDTECGLEAVNNAVRDLYQSGEPGTLTREKVRLAHNYYRDLMRQGVSPADRPTYDWDIVPRPTARPGAPRPPGPDEFPLAALSPEGPDVAPPAVAPAVACLDAPPVQAATALPGFSPAPAPAPPRAPAPRSATTCKDCLDPAAANHVCQGYCHWHHPTLAGGASASGALCGAPTSKKQRTCRLRALGIAGVPRCWVHASLLQRREVVGVLDPDAGSIPPHTSERVSAAPVVGRVALASPLAAMRHGDVTRVLAGLVPGSVLHVTAAARGARRAKWVARVLDSPTASTQATVEVAAVWCDPCGHWERRGSAASRMPDPDFTYYQVEAGAALPELAPDCGHVDDCDEGSDYGDRQAEPDDLRRLRANLSDPARATLPSMGTAPPSAWRVLDAKRWHPIASAAACPPHVHPLAWATVSSQTRQAHLRWLNRMRALPDDLNGAPLPRAAVELVLREAQSRRWAWSTISSSLATVASALRDAQYYVPTYGGQVIDVRTDPYFRDAAAHATRKARVTSLRPQKSAPLAHADFRTIADRLRGSDAWYLLQLTWYLAARIGDTRRLDPENVRVGDAADEHGNVHIEALFTEGKGASFWGPYTIHSTAPAPVAKQLAAYLRERRSRAPLPATGDDPATRSFHSFNQADQRHVAAELARFPDHSCRSLRRGALVHNAKAGATDAELQLLSGHKRKDTLLRYLGWGHESSEAAGAAASRAEKLARVGGAVGGDVSAPMKMGRWSGFNGARGSRVKAPPPLFPRQAPQSADLGLPADYDGTQDDFEGWTLHAHHVTIVDLPAVRAGVQSPTLAAEFDRATHLLHSTECYGLGGRPGLTKSQVPVSGFTEAQWLTFLEVGKITPLGARGPIRSAVRGFAVPQPNKRRWRPVFETLYNPFFDQSLVPPLAYPSRAERRASVAQFTFRIELDHFAWFDQFPLGDVGVYHVVRSAAPVPWQGVEHELFCLERLPMGATQSCGIANTTTWALMEAVIGMPDVYATSMVDNVIICSDDPTQFVAAVRRYVARAAACSADLNDLSIDGGKIPIPDTDEGILAVGAQLGVGPASFLGEEYVHRKVRNQASKVKKADAAYARLQRACEDSGVVVTRRQMASFIGLCVWMAATIGVHLRDHWEVLRLFSRLSQQAGSWEAHFSVTPAVLDALTPLYATLAANEPVIPSCPPLPSVDSDDYEAVAIVDASGTGYGAFVRLRCGRVFEVRGGWYGHLQHSAWAEPIGGLKIVEWLRERLPAGARVALVTDHSAMCYGQQRPASGNGGFSLAYHLNTFFQALYAFSPAAAVFFVEGARNVADAPSRATRLGSPQLVMELYDFAFPPLSDFHHPYLRPRERPWWCV